MQMDRFNLTHEDKLVLACFDSHEPIGVDVLRASIRGVAPLSAPYVETALSSMVECGLMTRSGGANPAYSLTIDGVGVANELNRKLGNPNPKFRTQKGM